MKLIARVALLLLILACAFSLSIAQDGKAQNPPPPALEYNSDNWKEFAPATGGYTILMPGLPVASKQEKVAFGDFPYDFYLLKTGTGDYKVGYFELPADISDPQQVKLILDTMRNQMLAMNKSLKLLNEREFRVEGQEAREWLIKDGDKILRSRTFFNGKRLYQITLTVSRNVAFHTGKPSEKASDRTDFYEGIATKFFDSFKLNNAGAATVTESGTGTAVGPKTVVSGGVINGKVIRKPAPTYPSAAKSAGAQGTVAVEITVDEEGKVIKARAISGHPLLHASAVAAAYKAQFTKTQIDGVPVKVTGVVTYNFVLH